MNTYRKWIERQPRYEMRDGASPDNPSFAKEFWRGLWCAITAAAALAIAIVLITLIYLFGEKYHL